MSPQPNATLTTLRPDLGGSVEEFDAAKDRLGFIGMDVLPVFETAVQAGTFGVIPLEDLLNTPTTDRAPGADYARGKGRFTEDSFACLEQGYEEPVDARQAKMYKNYFDAEMIAANRALDNVLRRQEIRAAAAIFNATTFASHTAAVTNEWDDFTNATPITDVRTANDAMYAATGLRPNALIINFNVFRNLKRVDEIIEALENTQNVLPGKMGIPQLQQAFELEHILVAGAGKNTSIDGQTAAIEQIWSDEYAMVAKIAETNDISEPCLGRTFHWAEDGSNIGGTMESYGENSNRSTIIRARMDIDQKLIMVPAGYLLSNITT
jgi:hypothetical protein